MGAEDIDIVRWDENGEMRGEEKIVARRKCRAWGNWKAGARFRAMVGSMSNAMDTGTGGGVVWGVAGL